MAYIRLQSKRLMMTDIETKSAREIQGRSLVSSRSAQESSFVRGGWAADGARARCGRSAA